MRSLDWHDNPLGPPADWPPELRTVVSIALGSQQPMLIVWGAEQITLYNDGYAAMCGKRHPAAFGKPFYDLWFDIWDRVDPIISAAYAGISTSMDDIEFTMYRNGYPEETHFSFSYTPVRSADGSVQGMFCACQEITGEVIARREKEQERERLRSVFEAALGAVAVTSGPDHVFTFANADYKLLVGQRDLIGRTVGGALPEVVEQGFLELLDRVYNSGVPYVGRGVSAELRRTFEGPLEQRFIDFLYHPVKDRAGTVEGIFVQALDVTEQHVLNRELAHRLKNQLALVQAIVNQSLRSSDDIGAIRQLVGERLAVLAAAHDAIISGKAEGAVVEDVIRSAASFQMGRVDDRIRINGPEMSIAPKPALSLSLIMHELLTNAVKYGALSTTEGQIDISWHTALNQNDEVIRLIWQEKDGPPVSKPNHIGSGTRLIRSGLAGTRHSSVALDFQPVGLRCEIVAELSTFQTEA